MADDIAVSELLFDCNDMLVDMAYQNIPCACFHTMLNYVTSELPSMPIDRRVECLRSFIARLEKTKEKYSNAAGAAAQTAAAPAAVAAVAAGAAAQPSQDFNGVGQCQDNAAAAVSRASRMRPATLRRCEAIRDFAFAFVKEQLANQEEPSEHRITVFVIAKAYAATTATESKSHTQVETLFKNHYLDLDAIIAAARSDDASLCSSIGSGRVSYNSIAAFLDAKSGKKAATSVKAAADWCVEKLKSMESGMHFADMQQKLLDMWSAADSDKPQNSGSLQNYFKNNIPFTIPKLQEYARSSGGGGEGGSGGSEARRGAPAYAAIAAPAARKRKRVPRNIDSGNSDGAAAAAAEAAEAAPSAATGESADAIRHPAHSPPPDTTSDAEGGGGDYAAAPPPEAPPPPAAAGRSAIAARRPRRGPVSAGGRRHRRAVAGGGKWCRRGR
jgi:hypothetical protein